MLGHAWQDVWYAGRTLRRNPGFTVAAVVTLTLGIASATAVFSVVSAALLRPLPYREPGNLVVLWQEYLQRGWGIVPVSHPNFASLTRQFTTIDGLAAVAFAPVALGGIAEPEMVVGASVSANAFHVLGVSAALGRTLAEADAAPGGDRVVVLADSLWRRRFGGDRGVIGRTIVVDGAPATVVGIMPRQFAFPPRLRVPIQQNPVTLPGAEVWRPLTVSLDPGRAGERSLFVVGRLAPRATLAAAREEATVLAPRLLKEFPGPANAGLTLVVRPLDEQVTGNLRRPLWLLLGAVGVVILIACVNVTTMLMARGVATRGDRALRAALGASPGRLIRERLAESLVLSGVSAALGLLLATWWIAMLTPSITQSIPLLTEITTDWRVGAFALFVAAAAGVAIALASALRDRTDRTGRGLLPRPAGVPRAYGRSLLTAEVALTTLLLVVAALFARSFHALTSVDPGFDPSRAIAVGLDLPAPRYASLDRRQTFHEEIHRRVGTLPGVEAVGLATRLPFTGGSGNGGLAIAGRNSSPDERPHAAQRVIDDSYIRAMGMTVVDGRGFDRRDVARAAQVALVNEAAARRFWPGANPIGQRVMPHGRGAWLTIVGIVGDVRSSALGVAAEPEVYWPFVQHPVESDARSLRVGIVVRARTTVAGLSSAIRRELRALDPSLVVTLDSTLESLIGASVAEPRVYAMSLGAFALFSAGVAASGVYGVLSFLVARRRREIGVRMALGAQPRRVLLLVLGEGLMPVAMGLIIGLTIAIGLQDLIAGQLYEVKADDPLTLVAVPVLLTGVAVAACYRPARRAARVDPASILRAE
jgi:putative ABC transport system permease protein